MKKFATVLLAMILLVSCASVTDVIYGPGLNQEELKGLIYDDCFALGAMLSSGKGKDAVAAMLTEASLVKSAVDPRGMLTQKWMESLKAGDQQGAMVYFAARRLYDRLNVKDIQDRLDLSALNVGLLEFAVNAYVDGINATLQ